VIDGGFKDTGEALVTHIKTHYRTDKVDLVISSHPDADHTSGLEVVLEELRVDALWMHRPWKHTEDMAWLFKDGRVTDTSVREDLRKSLENAASLEALATRKRIPITEPFAGLRDSTQHIFVVGPTQAFYESLLPSFRGTPEPKADLAILLKALAGVRELVQRVAERWDYETLDDEGETTAENNSSTIIIAVVDEKHLMFTADGGILALTDVASRLEAARYEFSALSFVQVPHHGSRRNVGPSILNRILGPKLQHDLKLRTAFVSIPKDPSAKHPSKKVTNAFRRRGAYIYPTTEYCLWHRFEAPDREGFSDATPLGFFDEVED
jgi:beta-lactamase superfamily II metal-dependent hydrolase